MVVGVMIALVGGVIVLVVGLIANRAQFVLMTDQLNPGWAGGIILTLIQVFFAANIIIWCVSWSFGPGFTIGDGSVISLVGTHVGLLPAFPISSALPSGPGSLLWLTFPIAAGVGAALTVLRVRPRARFDETALVGGLSGVLAGLGVAGLAALTGGDLGVDRLTGLGPFLLPLFVIAPSLMGLSGMCVGLVLGLIRRPTTKTDPRWWSRWGSEEEDLIMQTLPVQEVQASQESSDEKEPAFIRSWLAPILKRTQSEPPPREEKSVPTHKIKPIIAEQPPLNFHPEE